jgi:hypothetical protein
MAKRSSSDYKHLKSPRKRSRRTSPTKKRASHKSSSSDYWHLSSPRKKSRSNIYPTIKRASGARARSARGPGGRFVPREHDAASAPVGAAVARGGSGGAAAGPAAARGGSGGAAAGPAAARGRRGAAAGPAAARGGGAAAGPAAAQGGDWGLPAGLGPYPMGFVYPLVDAEHQHMPLESSYPFVQQTNQNVRSKNKMILKFLKTLLNKSPINSSYDIETNTGYYNIVKRFDAPQLRYIFKLSKTLSHLTAAERAAIRYHVGWNSKIPVERKYIDYIRLHPDDLGPDHVSPGVYDSDKRLQWESGIYEITRIFAESALAAADAPDGHNKDMQHFKQIYENQEESDRATIEEINRNEKRIQSLAAIRQPFILNNPGQESFCGISDYPIYALRAVVAPIETFPSIVPPAFTPRARFLERTLRPQMFFVMNAFLQTAANPKRRICGLSTLSNLGALLSLSRTPQNTLPIALKENMQKNLLYGLLISEDWTQILFRQTWFLDYACNRPIGNGHCPHSFALMISTIVVYCIEKIMQIPVHQQRSRYITLATNKPATFEKYGFLEQIRFIPSGVNYVQGRNWWEVRDIVEPPPQNNDVWMINRTHKAGEGLQIRPPDDEAVWYIMTIDLLHLIRNPIHFATDVLKTPNNVAKNIEDTYATGCISPPRNITITDDDGHPLRVGTEYCM